MYPALFAVIGNTYGGTLASPRLPNLQQRVPVGVGDGYALGATGGEAEHTLSVAEMPSHSHSDFKVNGQILKWGRVATTTNSGGATVPSTNAYNIGSVTWGTDSKGGGGAHNNMQPYTVVNWIIKV